MNKNIFTLSLNKCLFETTTFLMESMILPWGEDDQVVAAYANSTPCKPAEAQSLYIWHSYLSGSTKPGLVLDIGAYSGIYSLLACMSTPHIKSLAFEPSSVTFGRLSRNIALNKLFSRVIPFHGAAWSTNMQTQLPHRYGPLSLNSGDGLIATEISDHEEYISCMAPDSLLGNDPLPGAAGSKSLSSYRSLPIVAMKIDVEGAELEVLNGSKQIIDQYSPLIIAEALDLNAQKELRFFLEKLGYDVTFIDEDSNIIAYPPNKLKTGVSANPCCDFSRQFTYIL